MFKSQKVKGGIRMAARLGARLLMVLVAVLAMVLIVAPLTVGFAATDVESNRGEVPSGATMVPMPVAAAGLSQSLGGSTVLTNSQVTPFSVEVGGGVWDYGTKLVLTSSGIKKKVWSNYWHPTRWHASSVRIGTLYSG